MNGDKSTGSAPRHVIIHRDGIVGEEAEKTIEMAAKSGAKYDLVEIKKSRAPCVKQVGNVAGTPSSKSAVE